MTYTPLGNLTYFPRRDPVDHREQPIRFLFRFFKGRVYDPSNSSVTVTEY